MPNKEIDVVIAWVDGSQVSHKKKLESTLKALNKTNLPGAEKTRFGSDNEIKYCVLSILKFAPFVRNIFIVTDQQNPNLDADVEALFPGRSSSIKIIDHREIFAGYEHSLPTFNSLSIETFIWRIKGLADQFVYFNDDMFLIRPLEPEDWFYKGRPVIRGGWKLRPAIRLWGKGLVKILQKTKLYPTLGEDLKPTFFIGQWWAAAKLGFKLRFFASEHTPHAVDRRRLEDFYEQNKVVLKNNAAYQFRHYKQYNTVTLANHLEIIAGEPILKPASEMICLKPVNRHKKYVTNKIERCEKNNQIKFLCAQSLDMATTADQTNLLDWLKQRTSA